MNMKSICMTIRVYMPSYSYVGTYLWFVFLFSLLSVPHAKWKQKKKCISIATMQIFYQNGNDSRLPSHTHSHRHTHARTESYLCVHVDAVFFMYVFSGLFFSLEPMLFSMKFLFAYYFPLLFCFVLFFFPDTFVCMFVWIYICHLVIYIIHLEKVMRAPNNRNIFNNSADIFRPVGCLMFMLMLCVPLSARFNIDIAVPSTSIYIH